MKDMVKPVKYNKRKSDQAKSSYSLRGLVGEITGVYPEDINFDAEYTAVRRLVTAMQKATGNQEKIKRIPADEKEGFVVITKKLYKMLKYDQTGNAQKLFARMREQKQLTEEELNNLIDLFKEGLTANPNSELHRRTLARIEKEEQFSQMKIDVEELITNDIGLIEDGSNTLQREVRMKEYLAILKENTQLREWRDKATEDYQQEMIKRKMMIVAEEKGFDIQEVLEGKNPDLIKAVISEIVDRDMEQFLKQQSNEETDSN